MLIANRVSEVSPKRYRRLEKSGVAEYRKKEASAQ
jgi:hypothetical protein